MNDRPLAPVGSVVAFPADAREERARLLEIARSALPLLEAALHEDNVRLLKRVFESLGEAARGRDGRARLELVQLNDAQVIPLRPRR
jgi:hypothetical protein